MVEVDDDEPVVVVVPEAVCGFAAWFAGAVLLLLPLLLVVLLESLHPEQSAVALLGLGCCYICHMDTSQSFVSCAWQRWTFVSRGIPKKSAHHCLQGEAPHLQKVSFLPLPLLPSC